MNLLNLLFLVSISARATLAQDRCQVATIKTCGDCIGTPGCAWCESSTNASRCGRAEDTSWCQGTITNPVEKLDIVLNNNLNTNRGQVVQVQPQKISIKARPGKVLKFKLQYGQATDYPLDLYYLMDLSHSMLDDKMKLSQLGKTLAETMRIQSSNLRMGFGSFVDKVTMPFVNTLTEGLIPCTGCAPPYSFKNHLPLTEQTDRFPESVAATQISGNVDTPEGGFDALMQVMVCNKEIGWRNESLRMIIFSTDAESHYAGDGRLGGVVEPNDELCHMERGSYTHGLVQDYPSVAQISNNARKYKMNIIFAVTGGVIETYNVLKGAIHNSQTGKLQGDSSNVVKLIVDEYKKLTQSIIMDFPTMNSDVDVKLFSDCSGTRTETNECKVQGRGDVISFDVELTVNSCPADKSKRKQKLYISPRHISERLEIELEFDCECGCEKPGRFTENDTVYCKGHGDRKCGVCVCKENFWGADCGCDTKSATFDEGDKSACERNGEVCTSRGDCICGGCLCNDQQRYFGTFCECDRQRCPIGKNGLTCSGPNHGSCDCEGCRCKDGVWKGQDCGCAISESTCMPPGGGPICSGNGECKCGTCECKVVPGKGKFSGKYCDECQTCQDKCDDLRSCVQPYINREEGQGSEDIKPECLVYQMYRVENLTHEAISEALTQIQEGVQSRRLTREINLEVTLNGTDPAESLPDPEAVTNARQCNFYVQGCTYYYKYVQNRDKRLSVFVNKNKDCAEPVDILGVVLGLIGAILLAGIVMLVIWKVATTIHDRREYAKFEKERQAAMFDAGHNPLYKEPASTFQNPTFSSN